MVLFVCLVAEMLFVCTLCMLLVAVLLALKFCMTCQITWSHVAFRSLNRIFVVLYVLCRLAIPDGGFCYAF